MSPLEVANASPEAVGRHDREAWIALFTDDAEVHDPIGARGHTRAGLGAFWDTFIAANGVRFEVHADFLDEDLVVRDLDIHTTLSSGAVLVVPAHLRYRIRGDHVRRLYAHWELAAMIWQATLLGPRAWWSTTWMSIAMLRHLGLGGMWAYMGGLRGVGELGKEKAQEWARANGLRLEKVLAAGPHVTATAWRGQQRGVAHFEFEGDALGEVSLYFDRA